MFQTSSLSDWLSCSGWVALSSRFQSMLGRQAAYKNPDLNEFGHKSALPRRKTTTSDALAALRSSCFSV